MTALPSVALSVRQPWAWAIIYAGKDIENRSAAAVRHGMGLGEICIHAAKGMTQAEYQDARDFMRDLGVDCPQAEHLQRGGVIGVVDIVDIVKSSASPWFFGPCGLVIANARAVEPIPSVGALGYFRWQESGALDQPKPWMLGPRRSRKKPPQNLLI